jgi:hypothetical protein
MPWGYDGGVNRVAPSDRSRFQVPSTSIWNNKNLFKRILSQNMLQNMLIDGLAEGYRSDGHASAIIQP